MGSDKAVIRRALISVSDKAGVVEFARGLASDYLFSKAIQEHKTPAPRPRPAPRLTGFGPAVNSADNY
jgi:hypothetical protein